MTDFLDYGALEIWEDKQEAAKIPPQRMLRVMRAIGSLRTIKDQGLAHQLWMSTSLLGAAAVMSFFPPGLTASSVATYECEASRA
jgi:hypothetical protein